MPLTKAGGGSQCYRGIVSGGSIGVSCTAKPSSGTSALRRPATSSRTPTTTSRAGTARSQRLVQSVHDRNRSQPERRGHQLHLAVRELVDSQLASRQAGDHAELRVPDGRFLRKPAGHPGLDPRSCTLNSAATGITAVSPKTNPLQCNYLYAEEQRGGPVQLSLHPRSANRRVLGDGILSESHRDRG